MSDARFGRPRRHFRLTGSTNDEARALADAGAPSGTVVTAAEQDAGRGRHGRRWSAPSGSALLCSAILRPLEASHALLPLAVPVAVCEAVEALGGGPAAVKWPNDVWVEERKVAGVLIEARPPEWAVIGVGVNLSVSPEEFPDDLRWPAASLGKADPEAALAALCAALGQWVGAESERVLAEFGSRDALRGREVRWEGGGDPASGKGRAAGVDGTGNLVIETESGERVSLGAGEVSLRPAR